VLANIPITRWRIPPFIVAWIIPLSVGLVIGYVHPVWHGMAVQLPWVWSLGPLRSLLPALPYLSVIAPMAIYQILQDIAAVEGPTPPAITMTCAAWSPATESPRSCAAPQQRSHSGGLCLHPPYKAMGARIGFALWTSVMFLAIVMSGLTLFIAQLFPWPILAAMIAYVSVGVGMATLRHVDAKYRSAVLLGLSFPPAPLWLPP